jgi:rhodanese-related sulfurtransferase
MKTAVLAILMLVVMFLFQTPARADESTPRMTKEQLKALLDTPDIIVVDVRTPPSYRMSTYKIKGAVREDPTKPDTWLNKYPKDKTIVLYCT